MGLKWRVRDVVPTVTLNTGTVYVHMDDGYRKSLNIMYIIHVLHTMYVHLPNGVVEMFTLEDW